MPSIRQDHLLKPHTPFHRLRKRLTQPLTTRPTLHDGLVLQQGCMRAQSQRLQLSDLGNDACQPELSRLSSPVGAT